MFITLKQLQKKTNKNPLKLAENFEKEYNLMVEALNRKENQAKKQDFTPPGFEMINREGGDATLVNLPLLSAIHLSNYLAVARIVESLVAKKEKLAKLKILGVGEGSGSFAFYLALILKPKTYLATDYQPSLVDYGQTVFGSDKLQFVQLDATKMTSIKANSFDVVVACEFIEHIATEKLVAFFNEARRVLKKRGVVIATTPNKGCHPGKLYSGYPHHFTEFTAEELDFFIKTRLAGVFSQQTIFYLVNKKICQEKRRRLPFELVVNRIFGLFLKIFPKGSQRELILDKILTHLAKVMRKEIKRKKLSFPQEYNQTKLAHQSVDDKEAFGLCLALQT